MDNVNHLNELSIQSQLSILEKLVADAEQSTDARRDFEAQPRAVFQKYGITDLQIKAGNRKVSLYELVESTEKEARVPVARAVYRRIQLAYYDEDTEADPQTIPLVNVVLNANAVTNANIILNANAMANANANAQNNANLANLKYDVNTMGYGSAIFMNKPDVVELSESYKQTSVFRKFDQEGLSAARQAAVLKTAIKNSSSNTINPEGASNGVARGSYRSVEFEVTYSENEGTLVITDARLLAA